MTKTDCCKLPKPASRRDARFYLKMRDLMIASHCANKGRDHPCAGSITITATTITMSCALCGDVRQLLSERAAKP